MNTLIFLVEIAGATIFWADPQKRWPVISPIVFLEILRRILKREFLIPVPVRAKAKFEQKARFVFRVLKSAFWRLMIVFAISFVLATIFLGFQKYIF